MTVPDELRKRLNCAKLVEVIDEIRGYARIQTRMVYPDGSNIDVFLSLDADQVPRVTDHGTTMTWLSHLGIKPWATPRRNQQVDAILKSVGVDLDGGELTTPVGIEDESIAVIRVAQACSRVADLYLTKRQQAAQFREEVEEVVATFDLQFHVDQQLTGRNGWKVPVDMLVSGKTKKSAVICIEAIRPSVDDAHHRWYELLERQEQRITVYNDRSRDLDKANIDYLSGVSIVVPFADQQQIKRLLAA